MGIYLNKWMVAWNPGKPEEVMVGPWPDKSGWSRPFLFTSGCCYVERQKMQRSMQRTLMFIDFHTLVVRDGIDPKAAHKEFMKIDEYCRRISPDIDGAWWKNGEAGNV